NEALHPVCAGDHEGADRWRNEHVRNQHAKVGKTFAAGLPCGHRIRGSWGVEANRQKHNFMIGGRAGVFNPLDPGTRSMSPYETRMTSGGSAGAFALSTVSSGVTQTGHPGPCTSSIPCGSSSSMP